MSDASAHNSTNVLEFAPPPKRKRVTLEYIASDLERLIWQAKAAKELPLLIYLLEVALNEAQTSLEG